MMIPHCPDYRLTDGGKVVSPAHGRACNTVEQNRRQQLKTNHLFQVTQSGMYDAEHLIYCNLKTLQECCSELFAYGILRGGAL
jgi:hypothetical protein